MSSGPDPIVGREFPRPPAHAWRWLQRSRPVLRAIADRLTGEPPDAAFVEELQRAFATDAFTRAIVVDTIAEVAFRGRVPRAQPPGTSWDRGLRWWAAALAGVDPAEYGRSDPQPRVEQADLFAGQAPATGAGPDAEQLAAHARAHTGPASPQRIALARLLRSLLAAGDGEQVPASAVRQLIDDLEGPADLPDDG